MKYLEGEMRQAGVVGADYIQDTRDICWEVAQSLDVYDIVKGYSEGYVAKEKALELLRRERSFLFKKLRDWEELRHGMGLGLFEQAVFNFLGMRIGLISYAICMIEEEKIKPGITSSYEVSVILGLNAVGSGAHVKVLDEARKLKDIQKRESREGVAPSEPFRFENVVVWKISRLRSGAVLGTRLTGEVVNQSGVTYNSHAWFKVTLYNRAGEVLGWREFTTFEFRDGERKRFKVFFNDVDSSDVDWKIEFDRGS